VTEAPDHLLFLAIDGTPPSLNAIADMGAPLQAEVSALQPRIVELLRGSGQPASLERVEATAVLSFPDRRRRAPGNYSPVLARAIAGALVEEGWISSPGDLALAAPTFEKGAAATAVELRGWEARR